jgi:putative DeoR family transcriptional regulator (stage III sporulation protein D)
MINGKYADYVRKRTLAEAEHMINLKTTIRGTAKVFGVSKSTTHRDMSEILPRINSEIFIQVKSVLDVNKTERAIRGGLATRRKYRNCFV